MQYEDERSRFWKNVLSPIDFEINENVKFEGFSGITHRFPVIGQSRDEKTFILISEDPDPVKGILVGSDLNQKETEKNFIVVRPTVADTKEIILRSATRLASVGFTKEKLGEYFQNLSGDLDKLQGIKKENFLETIEGTIFEDMFRAMYYSTVMNGVNLFESLVHMVREGLMLDVKDLFENGGFRFDLLMNKETYSQDITAGACALPLQKFTETDWRNFLSDDAGESAKILLKEIGFYQYFRPPIDQASLALADRGVADSAVIVQGIAEADSLGHSIDEPELMPDTASLENIIEKLKENKLVVSTGELDIQLSREGRKERLNVKFQPREAFISRLIRKIPYLKTAVEIAEKVRTTDHSD